MSTEKPRQTRADAGEAASSKRARATARAKVRRAPDSSFWRRAGLVLAIIAAVIMMLYRPLRNYYIAWRAGYVLESRYEALADEYDELNDDLDRLMTREGIEDAARERGYVMPGETSVKVEGLEENVGEESGGKAADLTGEEDLPWYIHMGDAIFFYRSNS